MVFIGTSIKSVIKYFKRKGKLDFLLICWVMLSDCGLYSSALDTLPQPGVQGPLSVHEPFTGGSWNYVRLKTEDETEQQNNQMVQF